MALTELQRNSLINRINNLPLNTILPFFQTNEISFEDVPDISAERRQYIEEQMAKLPNPKEQEEWSYLSSLPPTPTYDLLDKIIKYIEHWGTILPAENHVREAEKWRDTIKAELDKQAAEAEKRDWEGVNPFSKSDLLDYLKKYPNSVHLNEIDDSIWSLTNKESVKDLNEYFQFLPQGKHVQEARDLLNALFEWEHVKNANDIFITHDYIRANSHTPFLNQAQILLMGLKQYEKQSMRTRPNEYPVERLKRLLEDGIVTENELILDNIITHNVLETLKSTDIKADLPDIRDAIVTSYAECKPGYTDVFFFGIPSTGKTCVLMGLSRSNSLHVNLASGGGDYAAALQQYTDVGVTVPPTPGDFVTTLEATISSSAEDKSVHKINLVEMSGEEFAFEIANNSDHIFTFEDMGSGTTRLLRNDNRKVFFLIIDPTANIIRHNHEIITGYDEQTGNPIKHLKSFAVNQNTLIHKLVDLFRAPGNAEIMKKVDSIHIIMTKSDMLGSPIDREEKAFSIFDNYYKNDILTPLIEIGKEYNINASTNFHPRLYTFSLGTFYVGGLYEYDRTDSNRLVKAIRNSTHAVKKKTWWDRLKETVNK